MTDPRSLAVISVKASDLQPGDQLFRNSHPNFDVAFVSEVHQGLPGPFGNATTPEPIVTVTFGSGTFQDLRADSSLMIFRPREGYDQ
jgi:hypothetical protein